MHLEEDVFIGKDFGERIMPSPANISGESLVEICKFFYHEITCHHNSQFPQHQFFEIEHHDKQKDPTFILLDTRNTNDLGQRLWDETPFHSTYVTTIMYGRRFPRKAQIKFEMNKTEIKYQCLIQKQNLHSRNKLKVYEPVISHNFTL